MEGAFVWEQWSTQKSINIDAKNTTINNITGIGNYDVGNIKLQRDMKNVWSLRGGSRKKRRGQNGGFPRAR